MNIYSISDLHLSFMKPKPMDMFGYNWQNHSEKIKDSWLSIVREEDFVLLPGDLSWAMNLEEVSEDIKFIENLPGKKILIKGNHDYWWQSLSKILKKNYKECYFIHNNSFNFGDYIFCGTRGWILPEDNSLTAENDKIYKRELLYLRMSLENAEKNKPIVVLLHYPPFFRDGSPSEFIKIIEDYSVIACVYGHIHGYFEDRKFLTGIYNNINYHLVSSDYLKFVLKKII